MRRARRPHLTDAERLELGRFVSEHRWYQSMRFGDLRTVALHDTDRLLDRISWPPFDLDGASFLDAGCNSGAHLYRALERGARLAVGLENSAEDIELARRALEWKVRLGEVDARAIRLLHADVHQARTVLAAQGLPDRYELVHLFSVLQHLRRPLPALRELAALTGRALIIEAICEPEHEGQRKIVWTSLPEEIPTEIEPQEVIVPLPDLVRVLQSTGGWRRIDHLGKGKTLSREVLLCWR